MAPRSLEQARAKGADIRPISSPQEALKIARGNPDRQVVFFVAGFETTMAPVAAMLMEGVPEFIPVALLQADLACGGDVARLRSARF